jgi:hypothetical protein
MNDKVFHLADLTDATFYEVRIEFTDRFEPSSLSGDGLPFVSADDEIHANSSSDKGAALREQCGRIPYGSPLYLWEVEINGKSKILYIGQTMLLAVQKRFEGHAAVVKLLADHVNNKESMVFFRLCSRLDVTYKVGNEVCARAIEHFPLVQAQRIIDDVEAYLIFNVKPKYNTQHKNYEKVYTKPFKIIDAKLSGQRCQHGHSHGRANARR